LLQRVGWYCFVESKPGSPTSTFGDPTKHTQQASTYSPVWKEVEPLFTCAPDLGAGKQDLAMKRGRHKSALKFAKFLQEELVYFIQKGQWVVLPYRLLMNNPTLQLHLRINPMGVVPQ
jgi:hypothetical protein